MRLFRAFDDNQDGQLNPDEFNALMGALRERRGMAGPGPRFDGGEQPASPERGRRPGPPDGDRRRPPRERRDAVDGPPGPPPLPGDEDPQSPPPPGRGVEGDGDRPPRDAAADADEAPDSDPGAATARRPLRPAVDQPF